MSDPAVSGRALDGVRVLDFTRLVPGAFCTLLLADLGADVIKIEPPGNGDPLRQFAPAHDGVGDYFRALNRNKRSVTLDLRAAAARPVLDALVARADVVVESFRPETAQQIGIDGGSLLRTHPGIVHCAISGFGQDGPYAERPGHDINYVALAGLLALDHMNLDEGTGAANGAGPSPSRAFLADIGGGAMSAAIGILAALLKRARTGAGSSIDISMHDGALAWLTFPGAPLLADRQAVLSGEPPMGRASACYNVYRTRDDRHVALGALEPKFWARFCERIGRRDLLDEQHATGARQAALHAEVTRVFLTRSRDEWVQMFADVDACLSPVYTVAEALDDPHVRARGSVVEVDGVRYLRSPVRMSSGAPLRAVAWPAVSTPPVLGDDTDAVLDEAGIDAPTRAALRARGVV